MYARHSEQMVCYNYATNGMITSHRTSFILLQNNELRIAKKEARPGNTPGRLLIGEELVPQLEADPLRWPTDQASDGNRHRPRLHSTNATSSAACAKYFENLFTWRTVFMFVCPWRLMLSGGGRPMARPR